MTTKKKTKKKTTAAQRPRNKDQDDYDDACMQDLIDALNYGERVKREMQRRADVDALRIIAWKWLEVMRDPTVTHAVVTLQHAAGYLFYMHLNVEPDRLRRDVQ